MPWAILPSYAFGNQLFGFLWGEADVPSGGSDLG